MKKIAWGIGIGFATLVMLFIFAKVTGLIQLFTIPTGSSEPNIKTGSLILASKLKKPHRRDFICYYRYDHFSGKKEIFIHRLCAVGGDKVEIRDGVLFVNDINADEGLNLGDEYRITSEESARLISADKKIEQQMVNLDNGVVIVYTDNKFLAANKVVGERVIAPVGKVDSEIVKMYERNWNRDQFGPIVVPSDSYFVLGDNRHNSLDSRYLGFISAKDLKAVVLR